MWANGEMTVPPEDYASLKAFFGWMLTHVKPVPANLPAESHPMAVLDRIEAKSMANARKGLGMAIGDILEQCARVAGDHLQRIDTALAAYGLITLSAARARFERKVRGIVKRGAVRNEGEYYALRNVVEAMAGEEQDRAWQMLAAFEEKQAT